MHRNVNCTAWTKTGVYCGTTSADETNYSSLVQDDISISSRLVSWYRVLFNDIPCEDGHWLSVQRRSPVDVVVVVGDEQPPPSCSRCPPCFWAPTASAPSSSPLARHRPPRRLLLARDWPPIAHGRGRAASRSCSSAWRLSLLVLAETVLQTAESWIDNNSIYI